MPLSLLPSVDRREGEIHDEDAEVGDDRLAAVGAVFVFDDLFLFDEFVEQAGHAVAADAELVAEEAGRAAAVRMVGEAVEDALAFPVEGQRAAAVLAVFGGGDELFVGLGFGPGDGAQPRLPRAAVIARELERSFVRQRRRRAFVDVEGPQTGLSRAAAGGQPQVVSTGVGLVRSTP